MEIKKSKFIGFCVKVSTTNEVESFLTKLKAEHKKAKHIAFAYILKNPHLEKCSDDGEPSGTAGRPILNVLQKRELSDCLICVVRYFGGIKLGAGGLVRAYGKSASEAIENANN